ncbi:hypothetical protein EV363DRAFT_1165093, partial [Boletus edulis]
LPPGPSGLPWARDVTGINPDAWRTYSEWARKYARLLTYDLIYTRMLGKVILIINSEKVAKDLLENRSTNHLDRPYLIPF